MDLVEETQQQHEKRSGLGRGFQECGRTVTALLSSRSWPTSSSSSPSSSLSSKPTSNVRREGSRKAVGERVRTATAASARQDRRPARVNQTTCSFVKNSLSDVEVRCSLVKCLITLQHTRFYGRIIVILLTCTWTESQLVQQGATQTFHHGMPPTWVQHPPKANFTMSDACVLNSLKINKDLARLNACMVEWSVSHDAL